MRGAVGGSSINFPSTPIQYLLEHTLQNDRAQHLNSHHVNIADNKLLNANLLATNFKRGRKLWTPIRLVMNQINSCLCIFLPAAFVYMA